MSRLLTIGALAKAVGMKAATIRTYESSGLLPAPARSASNRRLYGEEALCRLRFIGLARKLGFKVDDIHQFLALSDAPRHSCRQASTIAKRHLADIDSRIARLKTAKTEVALTIRQWA